MALRGRRRVLLVAGEGCQSLGRGGKCGCPSIAGRCSFDRQNFVRRGVQLVGRQRVIRPLYCVVMVSEPAAHAAAVHRNLNMRRPQYLLPFFVLSSLAACTSDPPAGEGTTFTVSLPRCELAPGTDEIERTAVNLEAVELEVESITQTDAVPVPATDHVANDKPLILIVLSHIKYTLFEARPRKK